MTRRPFRSRLLRFLAQRSIRFYLSPTMAATVIPAAFVPLGTSSLGDEGPTTRPTSMPTFQELLDATRDPDYATRVTAVEALGRFKDRDAAECAVPMLVAAADDESWFVRMTAIQSLAAIARGQADREDDVRGVERSGPPGTRGRR